MSFTHFILDHREALKSHIEKAISKLPYPGIKQDDPLIGSLIERMVDFAQEGKLLRGLLYLYAVKSYHSPDLTAHDWDVAAALEAAQSAFLIHDDVMDNDEVRRGKPSVFAQYAAETSSETGKNMAICVGDIFLFAALELMSQSVDDPQSALAMHHVVTREFRLVGIGQMEDLRLSNEQEPIALDTIIAMYRAKTARYTITLPLLLAATRAGFDAQSIDSVSRASEKVGIIFQIQDDLIGLYGDPETTGKPVGSDIREGKQTVVRALLMASASVDEQDRLQHIFGNPTITSDDIKMVQQMGDRFALRAQLDQVIQTYQNQIAQEPDPHGIIAEITQFLQNRQR